MQIYTAIAIGRMEFSLQTDGRINIRDQMNDEDKGISIGHTDGLTEIIEALTLFQTIAEHQEKGLHFDPAAYMQHKRKF